jgi:ribonuclease T1
VLLFGRPLAPRWLRTAGLAFLVAGATAAASFHAGAEAPAPQTATVTRAELPREALATERTIRLGGPFPYGKDGSVFGNRERLLPAKPRGHWREYTVDTPNARDRGPRRIVCGGEPPTAPESCYYSDDHYTSFRRIVQ